MKKKVLLFVFLCITSVLHAQVYKTLDVTAGGLSAALTSTEKNTVTNLTLTGTIDARDFKTMRDQMPVLSVIDLNAVHISAYTGTGGTESTSNIAYPENTVPARAFSSRSILTFVTLPASATAIAHRAFYNCTALNTIAIPPLVTSIGDYAFHNCSGLTAVTFPSVLTSIGNYAFNYCSGLTAVTFPPALTSIGDYAFNYCSGLTAVTFPSLLTSIGNYAFRSCHGLTTVTLPSSITSVSDRVFEWCTGLTTVTIPSSVTTIGGGAFAGCTGLITVVIPSSVTSIVPTAFQNQSGLFTVHVNNPNYSCIDGILFDKSKTILLNCPVSKTGSYTIPVSVDSVGYGAFYGCKDLTSITIPSSVTSIANSAFVNCTGLTSFSIPSSVTYLGSSAFSGCSNLASVSLPSSVSVLSSSLFNSCKSLTSIVIPSLVTTIGENAFSYCTSLASVSLPAAVTTLSSNAFSYCSNLASVSIPSYLTFTGDYVFRQCGNLSTINLYGNELLNLGSSIGVFEGVDKSKCVLQVPCGLAGQYAVALQWKDFSNIVKTNCPDNLPVACAGQDQLVPEGSVVTLDGSSSTDNQNRPVTYSWTAPPGITLNSATVAKPQFLAPEVFMDTPYTLYLTVNNGIASSTADEVTVTVSNIKTTFTTPGNLIIMLSEDELKTATSLKVKGTIDARDFRTMRDNMPGLTYLDLSEATVIAYTGAEGTAGNSVTTYSENSIPIRAIYNKRSLCTVILPLSVTSVGAYSFYGCRGLVSVTIPSSVTSIGDYAFEYCTALPSVRLLSSVTSIGYHAFGYCTSLTQFTIPTSITSINSSVFYYCTSLTSVTIPASVTSIGNQAFYNCSGLTALTIPVSVTTIGYQTFFNCTGLASVFIPATVTTINLQAFQNTKCPITVDANNPNYSSLDGVLFNKDKTTLIHCPGSKTGSYEIPSSVTSMYQYAFYNCSGLTSLTIPSSVTSIGSFSLFNCSGLTTLTIPSSVISISSSAFENCTGLTMIYSKRTDPVNLTSSSNVFYNIDKTRCKLIVPCGEPWITYSLANQWRDFTTILDDCPGNPPIAHAGMDQTVNEGVSVTLDGSASFDPGQHVLTYHWSAPAGIALSSYTTISATFTAPQVSTDTPFKFGLVVNNGTTASTPDLVTITVKNTGETAHFTKVWTDNGLDHMTFNIVKATLDGNNLEIGDEIALFDGNFCVGTGSLITTVDNQHILEIKASRDDGTGNGYIPGHVISYRFWDSSAGKEISAVKAVYLSSNPSWSTSGLYEPDATAFAELIALMASTVSIPFKNGWNIFSTNTIPADPDMLSLLQPLVDSGLLIKVQDENGNSLEDYGVFGGWINNIGGISFTEGYKIKVSGNCQLVITGEPAILPMDIPLKTGWNIISYPHTTEVDGLEIVHNLIETGKLIKMQDEVGNSIEDFGIFGGWVNNIGNFKPGKGYKIKVTSNTILTVNNSYGKSVTIIPPVLATDHFSPEVNGNGVDHMNINLVNLPLNMLEEGDEIGVFDGDICVGALKVHSSHFNVHSYSADEKSQITNHKSQITNFSIPVSASDLTGAQGFTEGHPFILKLWKKQTNQENLPETEILSGPSTFQKHESAFILLKNPVIKGPEVEINPDELDIRIYPNPTDGKLYLLCKGIPSKGLEVKVSNSAGQLVLHKTLTSDVDFVDLSGSSRGIYFIEMKKDSFTRFEKVVLR